MNESSVVLPLIRHSQPTDPFYRSVVDYCGRDFAETNALCCDRDQVAALKASAGIAET